MPMKVQERSKFVRLALFSNGIVDLISAVLLFFPVFTIPLAGYTSYTNQFAFVTGGWGIAAFSFGIGRIWASYRPEYYWIMVILGLIEGSILTLFCLINIFFLDISLMQAGMPLTVGSVFGVLYLISVISLMRNVKHG